MSQRPPEEPTSLIDSMRSVLKRLKMDDGDSVGSVFQSWDAVVGPDIAQHIQPVKLDNGVLIVDAVDTRGVSLREVLIVDACDSRGLV